VQRACVCLAGWVQRWGGCIDFAVAECGRCWWGGETSQQQQQQVMQRCQQQHLRSSNSSCRSAASAACITNLSKCSLGRRVESAPCGGFRASATLPFLAVALGCVCIDLAVTESQSLPVMIAQLGHCCGSQHG
jgi:hypothetical protein